MVDRKSEKAHSFKMAGYSDKWSTNQSFKYPDGKKISSKGQAHVGGYSQWDFLELEPGRELLIAKRIDYAYSGLVTGISVVEYHLTASRLPNPWAFTRKFISGDFRQWHTNKHDYSYPGYPRHNNPLQRTISSPFR